MLRRERGYDTVVRPSVCHSDSDVGVSLADRIVEFKNNYTNWCLRYRVAKKPDMSKGNHPEISDGIGVGYR